MRSRKKDTPLESEQIFISTDLDDRKHKYASQTVPYYVGILFILFLLLLFGIAVLVAKQLPTPLKRSDEALHPDRFIAERAQEDLKYLTDLGPRIVGSHENEVLALEILKRRISQIIKESHSNQHIELDVQAVSGSFDIDRKSSKMISVYANLQNVVVKMHGREPNNSLLLNAHFDSVPTSPGGSDDGINCAAMLEVLRKFSKLKNRPLHNVIFLFNGAEETGLQASHGFITKHKWAKECKVVVNLEAAGAGGKIMMFQTGPNRPWLNEDYSKVPHPSGTVISEEMFQSGKIPSDTDFRIFRDFGNMVGIDMAFVKDGYKYHTKYDGFDNIPLGSYQQVGDNVMSLVENIANNPELSNKNPKTGNVVFFDVISTFFISYNTCTAFILNMSVFGLSILTFLISLKRFNLGVTVKTVFYFIQILAHTLLGWFFALVSVAFIAYSLDYLGYSMSWYGHQWLVLGIYVLPIIITSTPMLLLIKPLHVSWNGNSFIQAQMIRLIWSTIMLVQTLLGIRATYFMMMVVLLDTMVYMFILLFRLEHSVWLWKLIYVIFSTVPTALTMVTTYEQFAFFIPLTGRMGSDKRPDFIIGFMTLYQTLLTLTPYYFLTSSLRKPAKFYKILVAIFAVCLAIVFTPLGFPYSGNALSPTPQRFWTLHIQRTIHGDNGNIIRDDSGYFFTNMDRNSPQSVRKYVDELENATDLEEDCNNYVFCGLPLAHQKMAEVIEYSTWVPASSPVISEPVNMKVHSKTTISPTVIRYNITISGPSHTMFFLSPKNNAKLKDTSLTEKLVGVDQPYYFFTYTCGKELEPLNAIFDFTVPEDYTGPTMDIAVVGNYVNPRKFVVTPEFRKFLSKFPKWVDMTAWVANYQLWVV